MMYTFQQMYEWYGAEAERIWANSEAPQFAEQSSLGAPQSSQLPYSGGSSSDAPQLATQSVQNAQVIVCTYDELQAMQATVGIGGKTACQKQRQLRTELFASKTWERDLTHGEWQWKHVLKALSQPVQQLIVGPGITKFSFRLLQHEMDPNYRKQDSGQRHVFQVERVDGSMVQLHFHKRGSMDPPNVFDAVPGQPHNLGSRTPLIGKNEAHMAMVHLLGSEQIPKALEVTNESAFQWSRFIQNQMRRHEIEGLGVAKAWIARFSHGGQPCLVIKRSDDSYCSVTPSNTRALLGEVTDPEVKEMLEDASSTATPWMQVQP